MDFIRKSMDFMRDYFQQIAASVEKVLGPVEEAEKVEVQIDDALCPFQSTPGFIARRNPVREALPYPTRGSSHAERVPFGPPPKEQTRAAFLFGDTEGNFYPHRPMTDHATDLQFFKLIKEKKLTLVPRKLRRELGRLERKRYNAIVAKRAKGGYPSQEAGGVEQRDQVVEQVGERT